MLRNYSWQAWENNWDAGEEILVSGVQGKCILLNYGSGPPPYSILSGTSHCVDRSDVSREAGICAAEPLDTWCL